MYLSKYIAHTGTCSRRKAVTLIKEGYVTINGQVQTNPAYVVRADDQIVCNGSLVTIAPGTLTILLNKPLNCLSSCADMEGRRTVLFYVSDLQVPRLYPIGRLDKQTTGVLLLTNDGELAYTLSHPRFQVPKVYQAILDKPFTAADARRLRTGITLTDGRIAADTLVWHNRRPTKVTVTLHSGRNRIVRRMFAHLGYTVVALDRILFAGLSYGKLARGAWRLLNAAEITRLRALIASS